MPLKVAVIVSRKFRARAKVCPDLVRGIIEAGDKALVVQAGDYREPVGDVAMFYGFDGSRQSNITRAFHDYKAAGLKAVYVDLGYFNNRKIDGRYGYHRFSVNDRHPTDYFQKFKHPGDRFKVHGLRVERWSPGKNIILAGMSEKCATFEGFAFEEWERDAIRRIRAVTDRPIIYRPKPKRSREQQSPPIEGVSFSDPLRYNLAHELRNAWAVVSHHSNAGIDALLVGVPCLCAEGVAAVMGHQDLEWIEQPIHPTDDERRQFFYDVAYCQFNRDEMRSGLAWRHLKGEGLVP